MESKRSDPGLPVALEQIQATLRDMQKEYQSITRAIETITGRVNVLSGVKEMQDSVASPKTVPVPAGVEALAPVSISDLPVPSDKVDEEEHATSVYRPRQSSLTSRIILTTYPSQTGIEPVQMKWGAKDYATRGPVVVSHNKSTVRRRNGKSSQARFHITLINGG